MTQGILGGQSQIIRSEIDRIIKLIVPFDKEESMHVSFTLDWLASGSEIYRIIKPANPETHLVSYFILVDVVNHKILLVDHKKAHLWLPPGGHVEIDEHPKDTVKREILEELNIQADFLLENPLFLTVTRTVGLTAGHTDVSLWYVLNGDSEQTIDYDHSEFNGVEWFNLEDIPYKDADPHLGRFIKKFTQEGGF